MNIYHYETSYHYSCVILIVKSEDENQEKIMELLKESQENRKSAENVAKHFLQKLDRSYGITSRVPGCHISPWEDLSSHSHTTR